VEGGREWDGDVLEEDEDRKDVWRGESAGGRS